jgi:hypothetical protein
MSAATETTHGPWCSDGPHVEDDTIHFYTAVEELYRQRAGRATIPSTTVMRAAATLLAAFDEAEEGTE